MKLAEREDTLEAANKTAADKVKDVEEIKTTTAKVLVRLQAMAVKEGEKRIMEPTQRNQSIQSSGPK